MFFYCFLWFHVGFWSIESRNLEKPIQKQSISIQSRNSLRKHMKKHTFGGLWDSTRETSVVEAYGMVPISAWSLVTAQLLAQSAPEESKLLLRCSVLGVHYAVKSSCLWALSLYSIHIVTFHWNSAFWNSWLWISCCWRSYCEMRFHANTLKPFLNWDFMKWIT